MYTPGMRSSSSAATYRHPRWGQSSQSAILRPLVRSSALLRSMAAAAQFTLGLADVAPLPETIPNDTNATTATIYMNALTECVQEKAQFAYVRGACDGPARNLQRSGCGARPLVRHSTLHAACHAPA